jgi:hypothetical protein
MYDDLNDENVLMYAMKSYSTPNCILSEFEEDFKRIKYIKRLFKKYRLLGNLKERLILNHMIVLSNVFGTECAVRLLFFKIDSEDYHVMKTFLLYLSYMPKMVEGINGRNILSSDITIDIFVINRLKVL